MMRCGQCLQSVHWWVTSVRALATFGAGSAFALCILLAIEQWRSNVRVPSSGMWWALVTFAYASFNSFYLRFAAFRGHMAFHIRDLTSLVLVILLNVTLGLLLHFYVQRYREPEKGDKDE